MKLRNSISELMEDFRNSITVLKRCFENGEEALNKTYFGDCRASLKELYEKGVRVQCCASSPPYFNLRNYGGGSLEIGSEDNLEDYINNLVEVFEDVKNLLTDDGTLWLNLGDSYNGSGGQGTKSRLFDDETAKAKGGRPVKLTTLKSKDLIGVPWRVAFALQNAGWYLRQEIIWHKTSTMPESVKDRCTKAHEHLFLLAKSPIYFFNQEAIKEPATTTDKSNRDRDASKLNNTPGRSKMKGLKTNHYLTRNKRSVWSVATSSYKGAHFAVYPPKLIEPCILAGTSPLGHCPKCFARHSYEMVDSGARRTLESYDGTAHKDYASNNVQDPSETKKRILESLSIVKEQRWKIGCGCGVPYVPDIVLDPFMGSGTTAYVARLHQRSWVGCELNPAYAALQQKRIYGK